MKSVVIAIIFLPLITFAQRKSKEEKLQERSKEAIEYYKYPTDNRTHKIIYEKEILVPSATKSELFKRASQFISLQNYGRVENVRCRNNTNVSTQIVDPTLFINDSDEGHIAGNGFMHLDFSIRSEFHYIVTFQYRFTVRDGGYKYIFTNFRVLEFQSAPKERSRSSGYSVTTGYGGAVGSSTGLRTFSDASLFQEDLENFIIRSVWQSKDVGHNAFKEQLRLLIGDLKSMMSGNI